MRKMQALRLCEFEYFCDVIALSVLLCDELYNKPVIALHNSGINRH